MMLEPKSLLRNFWLKFFSVALATVIWLGIHYSDRVPGLSISQLNINNITVPVGIVVQPGDNRVFRATPAEVSVVAVGNKDALIKGIRVYVDLTGFHGRQSSGEEIHAEAPPEINIITINPQTVAVEQISR
jgi:hypothetical protein